MSTVIKVENLGKQYRLGTVGTGTLSQDLNRWWAKIRGKEDPTLMLGDTNDRTKKGMSDWVWALRDINFEVKQGEVLGIIGRNGAGKSTLLKILSRTTTPTMGEFKVKGRIASLLEVGTGFHPELTGRENIFLNGAILGMRKHEIERKFDEIVDFSGVERYIDTPVKRYSSGMYVRLAFAVAAHLEPEILIIDEVLAVGDMEFQKKCLGKMKDVSTNEGRTVLFVSHNMSAIQNLCSTAIYLKNGELQSYGDSERILNQYLTANKSFAPDLEKIVAPVRIIRIDYMSIGQRNTNVFATQEAFQMRFSVQNTTNESFAVDILFSIYNQKQELVSQVSTLYNGQTIHLKPNQIAERTVKLNNPFMPGSYSINLALVEGTLHHHKVLYKIENLDAFEIEGGNPYNNGILPQYGSILMDTHWE